MKKIINTPETMIAEMCNGIVLAHPELEHLQNYNVIKKKITDPNKVSLIAGGGSGHEPAHAGYIGKGMLDAVVCGEVFSSPTHLQMYEAIMATRSNKGTLLIIKNYSGDIMNFKNASYMAELEGVDVDQIRVQDDIAVMDSLYTIGRRGVAGTVLVHKIAGAAAEKGLDLKSVKTIAEKASNNVKTIGFALSSCTMPSSGKPSFEIEEGEMEYGVGIHGEPGICREPLISAEELCKRMTNAILEELKPGSDPVAVLVNGFGATPLLELYLMNHFIRRELHISDVKVYREFVGNYMTSLDMAGASLSILKLDDELKELLDDDCYAPAFKACGHEKATDFIDLPAVCVDAKSDSFKIDTDSSFAKIEKSFTLSNMIYVIDIMANFIIENEAHFCDLDGYAGDGDLGISLAKGFSQVKREWGDLIQINDIGEFLTSLSRIIMEYCGGTSGPIWGFAFLEAGRSTKDKKELSVSEFADMLKAAVDGIQAVGERSFGRGAMIGDKTLVDALIPCVDSWQESAKTNAGFLESFSAGANAAVSGAEKTKDIIAQMGRTSILGKRSIGYPDAGACALGLIFTHISESIL